MESDAAHKAGIIDKIADGLTSEELLEAATVLALSEEVQGTPVSSRRVSSRKICSVSDSLLAKYEAEFALRNIPCELSLFAAMKAAARSESFEQGMEIEASLHEMLSKTPQAKAKQYYFFNNRRFDSHVLKNVPQNSEQSPHLSAYLRREKPQSTIPDSIKTTDPLLDVKSVAIMSYDAKSLHIAEKCALQGIHCTLIVVRILST